MNRYMREMYVCIYIYIINNLRNWILAQEGGQPAQLDSDTEIQGSSADRTALPCRADLGFP